MELDRASRVLELVVCAMWIVAIYIRMRSLRSSNAELIAGRISPAIRPILVGAYVVAALGGVLWTEARWQPFAHALTIPSLFMAGIAQAIMTLEPRRRANGEGEPKEAAVSG